MFLRSLTVLIALALLASCREAKVDSYRVPAEKPEPLPPILAGGLPAGNAGGKSEMAAATVPTAQGRGLAWTAPMEWKPKAASAMRKGSYAVSGSEGEADFSITAFPGEVGGELANFNRWRGQLDLPPLGQKDMEPLTTRLDQNGLHFAVVEFVNRASENPRRIVGALVPYDGATWFFKMIGPETLVAREKPQFFAFLQTIKPAAP